MFTSFHNLIWKQKTELPTVVQKPGSFDFDVSLLRKKNSRSQNFISEILTLVLSHVSQGSKLPSKKYLRKSQSCVQCKFISYMRTPLLSSWPASFSNQGFSYRSLRHGSSLWDFLHALRKGTRRVSMGIGRRVFKWSRPESHTLILSMFYQTEFSCLVTSNFREH